MTAPRECADRTFGLSMGFVAAILSAVLWGTELVLLKVIMDRGVPWPVAGFYTYAGAAVIILIYSLAKNKIAVRQRRTVWLWLLGIGLVGSIINVTTLKGIDLSDPTSAAIIQRTQILFAMLLGWLGLKERVNPGDIPAVVAMVVGFLIIQFLGKTPAPDSPETATALGASARIIGNVLLLVSAFCLALNATVIKRISRTVNREFIALVNTAVVTCSMAFFCSVGGASIASVWKLHCGTLAVAVGVLSGAGFLLYYFALSRVEVWKISCLQLLIPVAAAVSQFIVLGQKISASQGVGMLLIMFAAAVLILLHQRRRTLAPATEMESTE